MPAEVTATADKVALLEDGTIRLQWDTIVQTESRRRAKHYNVLLRRPTVAEWASYLSEAEQADAWKSTDENGQRLPRKLADLSSTEGPYLTMYARVIDELGDTTVKREELPVWMIDGKLMGELNLQWLTVPLDPSPGR